VESEFRDHEFLNDLSRLDRELEQLKSMDLERCELLVQSRSANEPAREWIPASDWRSA
jgi:hypothetical protein